MKLSKYQRFWKSTIALEVESTHSHQPMDGATYCTHDRHDNTEFVDKMKDYSLDFLIKENSGNLSLKNWFKKTLSEERWNYTNSKLKKG